jgi:hypothetical protein
MKKILMVLAAILIMAPILLLGGCERPGKTITQEYSLANFTRVQVGSAFQVEITPSDIYSVSVTAPENWFAHMTVEKASDTLEVSMNWGSWNFWHMTTQPKLKVTMPELEVLDISGAVEGTARGFESAKDFKLNISGASHLDMDIEAYDTSITISGASELKGDIDAHDVRLNLSGASNTTLNGTINNLNLQVSGASHATLDGLKGQDGRIELSGASHASISNDGIIDVFLSGASTLEFSGNPLLGTVDITGASSMHRQ